MTSPTGFYKAIKARRYYDGDLVEAWFNSVSQQQVMNIGDSMDGYISANLPTAIRSKRKLKDYRTSPYVLMATAGALQLDDLHELSKFLVDIKLYMGLETSFGKSIEKIVMNHYPLDAKENERWSSPIEKEEELASYKGLSQEEKSGRRIDSVWREIDSSCVHGNRRHLMTIKSGTSTINDTQVGGMFNAIRDNHQAWLSSSRDRFGVEGIDVVIGLTYGTDWGTNNKENQILAKLLTSGFSEVDRIKQPGVLQTLDGAVRVYRAIGIDYWSYTGNPSNPQLAQHVFLEVLLGLARAIRLANEKEDIGAALNERLDILANGFSALRFPEGNRLPRWVSSKLGLSELTWLASAFSAFFDET